MSWKLSLLDKENFPHNRQRELRELKLSDEAGSEEELQGRMIVPGKRIDEVTFSEFLKRLKFKPNSNSETRNDHELWSGSRISMTERARAHAPLTYETVIYDAFVRFAHQVHGSGCYAMHCSWRSFSGYFLETSVFHNLPIDGQVYERRKREVRPNGTMGDVLGFCYSVERDGKHHHIGEGELDDFLLNIGDVNKDWHEQVYEMRR